MCFSSLANLDTHFPYLSLSHLVFLVVLIGYLLFQLVCFCGAHICLKSFKLHPDASEYANA